MSSLFPSAENPRPRQVTFGATLAVTGGLVLLFGLLDLMTRLESLEVTQALRDGLRSVRLSGDVSLEQARDILRYSIMVFAVLCAAAVVLGIFTLKRDRAARVALTGVIGTIGVIALLGGPTTWLITAYVAVSLALLWSRSAREWFAGTHARGSAGPPSSQPPRPPQPPAPPPPPPPAGWRPPPYGPPPPGWGPPPGWPPVPPPPPPGWYPPPGWRPPVDPPSEPESGDDQPGEESPPTPPDSR